MKRITSFVAFLLILFGMMGCFHEEEPVPKITELPTIEQINEYLGGHSETKNKEYLAQIKLFIGQMPDDKQYAQIENAFGRWSAEQNILPIESFTVEFGQSKKINELYNQKFFKQIEFTARVAVDQSKISAPYDIFDDFLSSWLKAADKDTICRYRLSETKLEFYNIGGDISFGERKTNIVPDGADYDEVSGSVDWQLPGEYQAQTIAYNFAKKLDEEYYGPDFPRLANYPAAGLKEIGAEEGVVYIKIYLDGPEDTEDLKNRLEGWAGELYKELTVDKKAAAYLKTYGGDKTVIAFGEFGQFEF